MIIRKVLIQRFLIMAVHETSSRYQGNRVDLVRTISRSANDFQLTLAQSILPEIVFPSALLRKYEHVLNFKSIHAAVEQLDYIIDHVPEGITVEYPIWPPKRQRSNT